MVVVLFLFQVVEGHLVVQSVTAEEVATKLPLPLFFQTVMSVKRFKDSKNMCEKSVYYGKVNKALYNDTINIPGSLLDILHV